MKSMVTVRLQKNPVIANSVIARKILLDYFLTKQSKP